MIDFFILKKMSFPTPPVPTLPSPMPPSLLYSCLHLRGQRAVVTGASSGIGEQIALRLAELGCHLVLVSRREDRLRALQTRIRESIADESGEIDIVVLDVTDQKKVEELLAVPFAAKTDILVNNAGKSLGLAGADETPYDDMRGMFDTNIVAAAHLTQLFGAEMRKKNSGHVVFISSVAGRDFYEGGSVYCATKYAMNGYDHRLLSVERLLKGFQHPLSLLEGTIQ